MASGVPAVAVPWTDGEKIPDRNVRDIFRRPPDLPQAFYRSSLIIGSRGVGKTTLLRYLKSTHDGVGVHISLAAEFATLGRQTVYGPLAVDIPSALEPLVMGKSTSLIATALAIRLIRKGVRGNDDLFQACLPQSLSVPTTSDEEGLLRLQRQIAKTDLEAFDGVVDSHGLPDYVSSLGRAAESSHGPLLLLLDRADMVPPVSLVPVIDLLDQSQQFTALIAMRPGHASDVIANSGEGAVAGDHYQIVHLGIRPRTEVWRDFVKSAVGAQLGHLSLETIPEEVHAMVLQLSRESLRNALELYARYLQGDGEPALRLKEAIEDMRDNQLAAAQKTLQRHHPDFRRFINESKKESLNGKAGLDGPLIISFSATPSRSLFDHSNVLDRFVDSALRGGALCMPEGQKWLPGLRPSELEVPPLFMWQEGDLPWHASASPSKLHITRAKDALSVSGGPTKPPSLFIAYRMDFESSKAFRSHLEQEMQQNPLLHQVVVKDGRVLPGENWAPVIRERIRSARVVVGDVTGARPEVVFELGFAYGLKRVVIPVVESKAAFQDVPKWLRMTQLAHYGDRSGLAGVATAVATYLHDRDLARQSHKPDAFPPRAVWLRSLPWSEQAHAQFISACGQDGMRPETYGPEDDPEIVIEKACSSSLLVATIDGTEADSLVHYICGAIVARPSAGSGPRFNRKIVLVVEADGSEAEQLIASSLIRCADIVKVVKPSGVYAEVRAHCRVYRDWSRSRGSG
jgi:hypothetical protein